VTDQEETGVVKWFDPQKGYGFIERQGADDIFVHASALADPFMRPLQDGEQVKFTVGPGRKGPAAHNVQRVAE
jgi:CspA family cold shock protein